MKKILLVYLIILAAFAQDGIIKGNVFDKASGEALIGANVFIDGTTNGAATDIDGNFSFQIKAGKYTLTVDYVSYQKKQIKDIVVEAGKEVKLNIGIEEEVLSSDVVVVEAKLYDNNESGLLVAQKKSNKIFDAISSEQIKRSGDGNVGAALKRVTGVSLVGGKNVFVRGLGDRYSNVQLNGSILPSINPDKREVPVQIFSSNIIDNIVVSKTYSADQSGEFSGGAVEIKTKDFPGLRALTIGVGTGYNSSTTGEDYLTYNGGNYDFLGYDDGTRALPQHPSSINEFSNQWTPKRKVASPSQKYSVSFVNEYLIDDNPLGIVSSLSYSNDIESKDGNFVQVTTPNTNLYDFTTETGSFETNLSGMLNVFYKFSPNFKFGLKNLYVNSSEDEAKLVNGFDYNAGGSTPLQFRQTLLKFVQSEMFSSNLVSEIYLPDFLESKLKAEASYAVANRNEPDTRRTIRQVTLGGTGISTGRQMGNSHFFSEQADKNISARSNILMKLDYDLSLHTGFDLLFKDRQFQARRFNYK
ncbi:MAG: carboxypeptidase-like regulatory domain-containing protein, partial [Calditrichaeota bacterium]|nr:carboxypeptidase-like regulatory domain-containing protein [Calditrichota bacterium]